MCWDSIVIKGMCWGSGAHRKILNFSSSAMESRPFRANLAIANNHIAVCMAIITAQSISFNVIINFMIKRMLPFFVVLQPKSFG